MREVTGDYLIEWGEIEAELQVIKGSDIPAYNELLRAAGLPAIYLPREVSE